MKIRPAGAELFRADGRTDRHDDTDSRFSQCCERAYERALYDFKKLASMEIFRSKKEDKCREKVKYGRTV
jgi:hypothetical protein